MVEYELLEEDDKAVREEERLLTAALYVNAKGCGYPPSVQCEEWIAEFGRHNSTFPCHYSRADTSLAITHLDTDTARREVLLSVLLPAVTILVSGSALCLLHRGNCKCLRVEKFLER